MYIQTILLFAFILILGYLWKSTFIAMSVTKGKGVLFEPLLACPNQSINQSIYLICFVVQRFLKAAKKTIKVIIDGQVKFHKKRKNTSFILVSLEIQSPYIFLPVYQWFLVELAGKQ